MRAKSLSAEDQILTRDDANGVRYEKVVLCEASTDSETVYNLVVKGEFTFIADDLVAHSFSYFRNLRMILWSFLSISAPCALRKQGSPIS